jgi:hypothetical protein
VFWANDNNENKTIIVVINIVLQEFTYPPFFWGWFWDKQ